MTTATRDTQLDWRDEAAYAEEPTTGTTDDDSITMQFDRLNTSIQFLDWSESDNWPLEMFKDRLLSCEEQVCELMMREVAA